MEAFCEKLNSILPVLYALTTAGYLILFLTNGRRLKRTCRIFLLSSAFVHVSYLTLRGIGEGHIPLTSQGEAITFFACATILVYAYLEFRMKTQAMGVFVVSIVLVFQVIGSALYEPFMPIKPILQSPWFAFHAGSSTISFAGFSIAALLSVLYLLLYREITARKPGFIFRRIPSLESLDEMAYRSVTLAFILLTAGILSGAVWAEKAWGRFWSWDPKQISSLVVWLVYGGYLHARIRRGWEGKRVAVFAMIGFATLVFTFILVDKIFKTVHTFV